ncbi:MAG: hypothetical protein JW768_03880 [Chitinispirillaceae bacterium]|nr:hypothetical protein [Chitinispirillaceae bacterium]
MKRITGTSTIVSGTRTGCTISFLLSLAARREACDDAHRHGCGHDEGVGLVRRTGSSFSRISKIVFFAAYASLGLGQTPEERSPAAKRVSRSNSGERCGEQ